MKNKRIKIMPNGPYIVTGSIPLSEKIIEPNGNGYIYKAGREFPQSETYALCRCGKSKIAPFCDGTHHNSGFDCEETASKELFSSRAERLTGPALNLLDDGRCAFARFCHREKGDAWELTSLSDHEPERSEAIIAASECPAGRLVAVSKSGQAYEPAYEPSIEILQDPEEGAGCGIFVKGYIPLESSDGTEYERRNRVMLCRCGASKNKPFCDATHIDIEYNDKP